MDTEDGVIWVYGIGDDGAMAFTDFGIESLKELIRTRAPQPVESLIHCPRLSSDGYPEAAVSIEANSSSGADFPSCTAMVML